MHRVLGHPSHSRAKKWHQNSSYMFKQYVNMFWFVFWSYDFKCLQCQFTDEGELSGIRTSTSKDLTCTVGRVARSWVEPLLIWVVLEKQIQTIQIYTSVLSRIPPSRCIGKVQTAGNGSQERPEKRCREYDSLMGWENQKSWRTCLETWMSGLPQSGCCPCNPDTDKRYPVDGWLLLVVGWHILTSTHWPHTTFLQTG